MGTEREKEGVEMAFELFFPPSFPGSGSRGRQSCVALTKCSLGCVGAGVWMCVCCVEGDVCVCERQTFHTKASVAILPSPGRGWGGSVLNNPPH